MRAPRGPCAFFALLCAACAGSHGGPRTEPRGPVVCPHDAVATGGTCRCAPGLSVLEGACVGPREIDAYCGTRASGTSGCTAPTCASGDPLDLATATCAPARTAREIVARSRPVPDDMLLGCHEGQALVLHSDQVACMPLADTCPRATAWDARSGRCAPLPACAPGEVRDEACIRVVTRASGGVPVVDVGGWARAMLGVDGGEGTSRLCRPLAERPWDLDVGPGGARTVGLTIELRFPDNDVTQLSGRAEASDPASGQPLVGGGAGAARGAQAALDALLVPLRALGGVSDAASATVRVRCTVRGGGSPVLVPRPFPRPFPG